MLLAALLCLASCGSAEPTDGGSGAGKDEATPAKVGQCPVGLAGGD